MNARALLDGMEGTHIQFTPLAQTGKTGRWAVVAKEGGTLLGTVKWYGAWRCHCFFAEPGTLYEKTCLRDIAAFCEEQTARQRATRAVSRG